MKAEFKNVHSILGQRSLLFEFVEDGNFVSIRINSGSLVTMIDDNQVDDLIKFLNSWKAAKEP